MSTLKGSTMSRLSQLKHHFSEWRRRARSRRELASLGEMGFHDIGISRCDAEGEFHKRFWKS